jgi:arylsulfatase A-like enzyme
MKESDSYLPATISTLAETLARHGFLTAAVVNSYNLSDHYGLERGFQRFHYVRENAGQREPGTAVTERALRWLTTHADKRLFLFVHYYDVHSDYVSRPEFERLFESGYRGPVDGTTRQLREFRAGRIRFRPEDAARLVDLYDAGIRQLDQELQRLLSAIDSRALVFITSDHGEEFLERGGVLHGRTQFQELVRVPLLVRGPRLPPGLRVSTPVSLVDVVPTLLRLVGLDPLPGIDGEELTSLWTDAARPGLKDRVLFGEADHGNAESDITRAVRRGRHKLHYNRLTRVSQLFDLETDPGEREDRVTKEPEVVAGLDQRLARFLTISPPAGKSAPLSPEEAERLRSLGYLQ